MKDYQLLTGLNYATTLPEYNDLYKNTITGILGMEELGRSTYVKYIIKNFRRAVRNIRLRCILLIIETVN